MINKLHARLYRPEMGWDPVPADHAQQYAEKEWRHVDETVLDFIEANAGSLAGKEVLDLGAGPGHYTAALMRRGAAVTWYDISFRYQELAKLHIAATGIHGEIHYDLGYMDEAPERLGRQFDLVFNRIAWYYSFNDATFARTIVRLLRPGGWAYVDTHHSTTLRHSTRTVRLQTWLNDNLAIKIGHPYPPHGRLARLFLRFPAREMLVDYRVADNDRILFQKAC